MRKQSPQTELKLLRSRAKRLTDELASANRSVEIFRSRAISAESELAEWKSRFDKLIKLIPKEFK